ncbi:MAG TPA: nitroreductase [Pseudonocardiaceae bacterium]|nr:nitroreductase [Pseudonocardiaceae bacterium]
MNMDKNQPDRATIRVALEVACRAPSVHNTQPWRWMIADHSVHLFADRTRRLPVIDHDGRELVTSCGAALHHARIAFRGLGWKPTVHRLPNPADPDHLAAIELTPLPRIDRHVLALVSATATRRSDRRPFLPDALPDPLLAQLVAGVLAEGVGFTVLQPPAARREVVVALAHAEATQRADPMYQGELAEWTHSRLGAVHGVPARNVPARSAFDRGTPGRDFGIGELENPPPLDDGALLCVLSTTVDGAKHWLRVGEALSAVTLTAAANGVASCTLSQVAEVRATRDLVRRFALGGIGEPQVVVRLGWPATATYPGEMTPRRPIEDVVSQWPDE